MCALLPLYGVQLLFLLSINCFFDVGIDGIVLESNQYDYFAHFLI